jgi:endoglucanase
MFIDVGAKSAQDCPVRIGDMAVLERSYHEIGDRLTSQALGDRAGLIVLIQTLRSLSTTPNDVFLVFAVQGAVGSRGLRTASYGIDPEIAIAIGSVPAKEAADPAGPDLALGRGPAVKIRGSTTLSDPRLVSWMARAAEKAHIPLQRAALDSENTETLYLQNSRSGVPAAALCIPVRYRGSPSEMIAMDDLAYASQLLVALLRTPARLEA